VNPETASAAAKKTAKADDRTGAATVCGMLLLQMGYRMRTLFRLKFFDTR
jgi:hypothetical protein